MKYVWKPNTNLNPTNISRGLNFTFNIYVHFLYDNRYVVRGMEY